MVVLVGVGLLMEMGMRLRFRRYFRRYLFHHCLRRQCRNPDSVVHRIL